jgi:hypothetical protein
VTFAVSAPVWTTGGTPVSPRSTDALAMVLDADVDSGSRVAVFVMAPIVTPAATPIPLALTVPFVAGAVAIGPTSVMPANKGDTAAKLMSTASAVAVPPLDASAVGGATTPTVSAAKTATTRIRISCQRDLPTCSAPPTRLDRLAPERSRFALRSGPRPTVSRPWWPPRSA